MMIKKLKNMDWFDIFTVGILSLFGVIALMLVVISPIYTVASYQHKETHQGTITDKYNKSYKRGIMKIRKVNVYMLRKLLLIVFNF
ncbi:hypothetical protein W124_02140 [Staphylococcus aureus DAR3567]|nr:hypothetical protein W124_02140 [Staphylococcus aureus DAR3567]